jgi:plastocyanin
MAHLSGLLSVVLAVVAFCAVSASTVTYNVTFVTCVQGSTCPQGDLTSFNKSFALDNVIAPNVTLIVGDQLVFNLQTSTGIHPLSICQNSPLPKFCQGASGTDLLNTPITNAGSNTSYTFTTAGVYYYGCNNHPGMGATIIVLSGIGGD